MTSKAARRPDGAARAPLERWRSAYLGTHDPRAPLASPLYADLSGLPPLLLQVGTAECCSTTPPPCRAGPQSRVDVTLEPWDDMIHVWQSFAPLLHEATAAIERIGGFVRARTAPLRT